MNIKKIILLTSISLVSNFYLHSTNNYYQINISSGVNVNNELNNNNNSNNSNNSNNEIKEEEDFQGWLNFINNQCVGNGANYHNYNTIEELQNDAANNFVYFGCQNSNINALPSGTGMPNVWNNATLNLINNNITEITGLSNVERASILLANNPITSLRGLQNLKSVSQLDLQNVNIKNFEGLENLEVSTYQIKLNNSKIESFQGFNVRSISLLSVINENNLTDISALKSIEIIDGNLSLDLNQEPTIKIPSSSYICSEAIDDGYVSYTINGNDIYDESEIKAALCD